MKTAFMLLGIFFFCAAAGLAALVIHGLRAWRLRRQAAKQWAMDPVRRLRR